MKLLNKLKISLFISFFVIILLHIKVFATTGIITEITVNVREKASTDSKKIVYVTQDDEVEVLEKVGDWYKIKAKNKTGYVFGQYIKVDDTKLEQETTNTTEQEQTQENNADDQEQGATQNVEKKLKISSKTQVRLTPNISSSVIYTSKKDVSVNIIEQINNWTYISVSNVLGWVRTDKIVEENQATSEEKEVKETSETKQEETSTTKQETKIGYIKYDTVNLRKKASATSEIIAKLKLNAEVTIIEKVNTVWTKVEIDGETGYVSTDLIADQKQKETKNTDINTTSRNGEDTSREDTVTSEEKEKTTTNEIVENTVVEKDESKENSSSKATGADIVTYAKKYLGYDYVYGGTSPNTGFDCSGFTYYVYKHFGYTISRSSVAQATNGTKVAKSDLQPGDLVIYKNTSLTKIGHVGIYIGNNKMIHASEPGVGVVITDIDSKAHKYPQRFVMGRRIIK